MSLPSEVILRPGSLGRLSELWSYRDLLFSLVQREVRIRYKQTLVGVAWVVLQPLATALVFALFFGSWAKLPSGGVPPLVFYFSGLVPWMYFAAALSGAANSLVDYRYLLSKVYFPRLILPLAAVMVGAIDVGITFLVLLSILVLHGMPIGPSVLVAPVFLLLVSFSAFAVGLWLSALNALYRDVRFALPFVIQFWLFLSPVVYPSSVIPEKWQLIYALNPMTGIIEGFRWSLLGTEPFPVKPILISMGVLLLLAIGGLRYFRQVEKTLVDWV
uniref:Transport permease protein n=1 Tax=uncultured Bacteroidota bacterium TaxID=152509 RepID=H5SMQ6_9BACT|nr:ABC-2 type transport system related protein [uncultured Bacteroidetes bacterium]